MIDKDKIINLFEALNDKLEREAISVEICLCGGAAMCLAFNARNSTKDVDAIFVPTKKIGLMMGLKCFLLKG